MGKKENHAIDVLNRQIGKLDDPTYPTTNLWAIQTASFIKSFFGVDSVEYNHIKDMGVVDEWGLPRDWDKKHKDNARLFLKQCIQTIERIGLYEPPRGNIFTTMRNDILISAILGIIGGAFALGIYIGNVTSNMDRYELKDELRTKTDSMEIYRSYAKLLNSRMKFVVPIDVPKPIFDNNQIVSNDSILRGQANKKNVDISKPSR